MVARVLHQPPTCVDKALLEAGQRRRVDPLRGDEACVPQAQLSSGSDLQRDPAQQTQ